MTKENKTKEKYEATPMLKNYLQTSRVLLAFFVIISLFYFSWWLNVGNSGNVLLYALLLMGETYHIFQGFGYAMVIYKLKPPQYVKLTEFYPVDVFITVCGEPVEIVERTIKAALALDYPDFHVYVLNDGKVANKPNWKEIDALAAKLGVPSITRSISGGFKAGNVNNALALTESPYIAIFDADQVPNKNFLVRTMGHFKDPKMAFVQTPQYYENNKENFVTKAAWEQQELFFGPICVGKNWSNSAFWCGTNAIINRKALESIGGVPQNNIAEDFLASLFMHQKGWRSVYVPEILAQGKAPYNLRDYVSQQFRWARGSLEIVFKYNPLIRKGLTWKQKFQYLNSASYYLNGLIILIDAIIPLLALGFNIIPVKANTANFVVYFIPFIASTIYLLVTSTNNSITFKAIQFSSGSFYVYLQATVAALLGINSKFKVTPKTKESGNYLRFVIPHIVYGVVGVWSVAAAIIRAGITPSIINNASWVIFNFVFFTAFIRAAYPWERLYNPVKLFVQKLAPQTKDDMRPQFDYVTESDVVSAVEEDVWKKRQPQ